jgi:hypothetical protein
VDHAQQNNLIKVVAENHSGLYETTGTQLSQIQNKQKRILPHANKGIKLFGYADALFVAGADSKSQLGYCFF